MGNTIESSAERIRVDADYFFYPEGESNFKEIRTNGLNLFNT